MYCPHCSTEIPDDAKFCIKCRYDLTRIKTPPSRKAFSDPLDDIETSLGQEIDTSSFAKGSLFANRYEILSEGLKGGMGVVYKCKDTMLNKIKALKVIHPRLLSSKQALSRFRQEVAISQELNHENIVRVYDIESWDGKEYFTMEWVEGVTLRDIITERKKEHRPFSIEEAEKIISQLANALSHAHTYTIHRDIKPENILITNEKELKVKLSDFGIAKMLSPSQFTSTSMQMGTPYYMAPEQKVDAGNVDKRADIYALGVVLFELLTLENTIGLELPSELNKDLPSVIDNTIKKAVATKPDDRYGDAKEFSDALQKVVNRFPEQAEITPKEAEERKQKEKKEQAEKERRVRGKKEAEQKRIENEQRLQIEQNEAREKAEKEKLTYGRKAVYIIVGFLVLIGAYNYFSSRQGPSNGLEIQSPTPGPSPAPAPGPAPAPRPAPVEATAPAPAPARTPAPAQHIGVNATTLQSGLLKGIWEGYLKEVKGGLRTFDAKLNITQSADGLTFGGVAEFRGRGTTEEYEILDGTFDGANFRFRCKEPNGINYRQYWGNVSRNNFTGFAAWDCYQCDYWGTLSLTKQP